MDNTPLVYRSSNILDFMELPENCMFSIWTPSLANPVMQGLPIKFLAFYFFRWLGVFGNKHLFGVRIIDGNAPSKSVASLLVVPAFYKWPFMGKQDVQFIAVSVDENFRGRRLATAMMKKATEIIQNPEVQYWYVTNVWNEASQRAAINSGFELVGEARREKALFGQKILHLKS